ncbi:MAG: SDR family oxidoreductase [Planctomycetes bacterium]|nr:SDR family oxidoreductase [Planctomycetota bacterium]
MQPACLIIGCGYLGQRVAAARVSQGWRVYALTRSTDRALEFQAAGIVPLLGDVTQADSLPDFPAVDTLLYAVGLDRRTGHSQRDVYVEGLNHVLPLLSGRTQRAIYISSTSVYGQNDGTWVDEASECTPTSANGQVCLEAERLFQQYLPQANILRLSGIYGPGRLIARIDALRAGTSPGGNPDAWLNLIHIADATRAVLACDQSSAAGTTYLISDNEPVRRRDFYSRLAEQIGAPPPFPESGIVAAPTSDALELNKRCRNRRMREELGVQLQFPDFRSGLPDALSKPPAAN